MTFQACRKQKKKRQHATLLSSPQRLGWLQNPTKKNAPKSENLHIQRPKSKKKNRKKRIHLSARGGGGCWGLERVLERTPPPAFQRSNIFAGTWGGEAFRPLVFDHCTTFYRFFFVVGFATFFFSPKKFTFLGEPWTVVRFFFCVCVCVLSVDYFHFLANFASRLWIDSLKGFSIRKKNDFSAIILSRSLIWCDRRSNSSKRFDEKRAIFFLNLHTLFDLNSSRTAILPGFYRVFVRPLWNWTCGLKTCEKERISERINAVNPPDFVWFRGKKKPGVRFIFISRHFPAR